MNTPKVIVVGAGAGGISTAARLAQNGYRVTVVEKHDFVGGRCSLIHKDGYRFDQGPSLVLMQEVIRETFTDLSTTLENENIHLVKCEPNYCIWFDDKDTIELSTDFSSLRFQIQHHEGPDGFARFCAFLSEAGIHYDVSLEQVLRRNFPGLLSMLRPAVLKSLVALHPWTSVYARAKRYFRSDKMRRAWTFASMYMGMSPYKAPGTYSLLQYIETVDGIWYPVGGFQRILQSLSNISQRLGVEYKLNTPVKSILLSPDNRTANGVVLSSGEKLHADLVIINADLVYAYNNLLPPSPQAQSLERRPASCSSISFFWAIDSKLPQLRPHNIFLAEQYRESFDAIFDEHRIPDDPSFYVNVPSRVDASAAPKGKEAVVVLVPVGHLDSRRGENDERSWDDLVDRTRETVLHTIDARTGVQDLRSKIVHESIETPLTWQEKFNLDRGAILGLSHSFWNVLCFRPRTKHPDIQGLYFVGASTHPGTGVPVCLAGGKLVADQVMEDWNDAVEGLRVGKMRLAVIVGVVVAMVSLFSQMQFSVLLQSWGGIP